MSDRERAMLEALAELEQLTPSEYVRHLVRREHEARAHEIKPARRKKAKP